MHVLLTGTTSQQCNPESDKQVANYPGLLRKALQANEHDVHWREPSISWTAGDLMAKYDFVIVGLAPVTSLSANRVYGALSIIDEMLTQYPDKLGILVDAPDPERIAAGNRAMLSHPENLCKIFYSYRKEYELAARHQERLLRCIERLHTETWPTTIVPALPWNVPELQQSRFPYPVKRLVSLNLDELLFAESKYREVHPRQEAWLIEGEVNRAVSWPKHRIPRKGYAGIDTSVLRLMSMASGVLLAAPKEGTWWNTRYAQAAITGTPAFSNWKETAALGDSWGILPGVLETLTPTQRDEVARGQLKEYRAACATSQEIKSQVQHLLRSRSKAKV